MPFKGLAKAKHGKHGFFKTDSEILASTAFLIRMAGDSQKLLIAL